MDNCFVKTLKKELPIENPEYFNSLVVKLAANSTIGIAPVSDSSLTLIVIEGTLYMSDGTTPAATAGGSYTIAAGAAPQNFKTTSATTIRFDDNNHVKKAEVTAGGYAVPTHLIHFAPLLYAENLGGVGSNWGGTVEEYVEKISLFGKASGYIQVSGNAPTFHGVSQNQQRFKIIFSNSTVTVDRISAQTSIFVTEGTYTKATGVWTYN